MQTRPAAPARPNHRRPPAAAAVLAAILAAAVPGAASAAAAPHPADVAATASRADLASLGWVWPLEQFALARPFVAPAHEYGAGHRGIDLRPAADGGAVRAPADGVVAFSGAVAGRGILTIDHGEGLVTTLEPVRSPLVAGTAVTRGQNVATIALGGHADPGSLHFGVRRDGDYINPLLLYGGVPRAVLLPCCG